MSGTDPLPEAVRVAPGSALVGEVRTPGDKSISHRALLIGALAEGTSELRGLSDGDDVRRSAQAVAQLGATVRRVGPATTVDGGRARLQAGGTIDCGNSGTSMRLLAGVLAGLDGETVLTGDDSLSARPMDRIAEPLAAMGATVTGRGPRQLPPLTVRGGRLRAVTWAPPMASAQVKSAILFAGLDADGETVVEEAVPTRAHTEELLAAAGAAITVEPLAVGRRVRLRPSRLAPLDLDVPGDPSQAAFWLVGGCVVPGSKVRVRRVYAGGERIGFLGVLERMGATVSIEPLPDGSAEMTAEHSELSGTTVAAAEIPSLDEVPILAVAAAAARGTTTFADVAELRVKETDRFAATIRLVEALGARAQAVGDDLVVTGTGRLGPGPVDFEAEGDHRMAMAAVVGALGSPGGGRVGGMAAVATSYPGFLTDLSRLGGADAWEPATAAR